MIIVPHGSTGMQQPAYGKSEKNILKDHLPRTGPTTPLVPLTITVTGKLYYGTSKCGDLKVRQHRLLSKWVGT